MVKFENAEGALTSALQEATEIARKAKHHPGTWRLGDAGATSGKITLYVDRLATQLLIESTGNLRNFPGAINFILENTDHRA